MALWVCNRCTTKFAVGLPYCPQCTSTDAREDGDVPKNNVYGGASNVDAEQVETEEKIEQAKELTIVELRDELRDRGLKTSGNKDELAARLAADDQAKAETALEPEAGEDGDA